MERERLERYFQVYSTDYEKAVADYYTDDIVFEYAGRRYSGKAEVLDYFRSIRVNFQETLRPVDIILEADRAAAEVDAELVAVRDLPEFWGRPFRQGEAVRMTFGIFYRFREGRISRVRIYRP